jgi:hypothetical protein
VTFSRNDIVRQGAAADPQDAAFRTQNISTAMLVALWLRGMALFIFPLIDCTQYYVSYCQILVDIQGLLP